MFYSFSKPGAYHLRRGGENQDHVACLTYGGIQGLALADGAGSARYGRLGAKETCRAALEYALPRFERLYARAGPDTIRYEIVAAVQAELDRLVRDLELKGREELGSTLLLLCADRHSGRYLCLHMGDGLVGCVHQGRLFPISSPSNGITRLFTTLTSSPDCLARARVYRGQRAGASFFLLSDGCTRVIWDGEDFRFPADDMLRGKQWTRLEEEMDRQMPEDDYSFVALIPE